MMNDEDSWMRPWKYKPMELEDHFSLPVFKLSRLLNKVTGLQVTSPDLDGRESEIPIDFHLAEAINATSDHWRVVLYFIINKISRTNYVKSRVKY